MSSKGHHSLYRTPLNLSQTIDLPSNLLQAKPRINSSFKAESRQTYLPHYSQINQLSSTNNTQFIPSQNQSQGKKGETVTLIEQRNQRKNVLYKRLSDIKGQNKQLQKYSYSKLLSKMVVSDPMEQYKSLNYDQDNTRTISEYSCLRGKLLNLEDMQQNSEVNRQRNNSGCNNYYSRTTRIFKRYYMPSSEKEKSAFFVPPVEQKYIYINGKKTQCKRIHNYYTSQNFRNSYDKAFGKTKDSFYSSAARYDREL